MNRLNHKRINDLLTVLVVVLGVYIALAPFAPHISLWARSVFDSTDGYKYQGDLASLSGSEHAGDAPAPEDNTLLIPSLLLDETIVEGEEISVIEDGDVWRLPDSSTPEEGGNTVIVGHRWSYQNPATFYHLDKMEVGEKFSIYWNQQEYVYEVSETKVVPITAIDVEAQTKDPTLTLYTCTPLWTATERLVIVSKLISAPEVQS